MPSYRIALGSRLIIENGTTASPNYSGLTFEVSGLSYQNLGDAVNASKVPITNLWSGTALLDNRAQTFLGPTTFAQPLIAQQASIPGQLATLAQVASYNNLSGTGGGGGSNNNSQLSGVQSLAISTQSTTTALKLIGNSLRVDAVNGIDSSGLSGDFSHPFRTLGAAQSVALSGTTIFVEPGNYLVTDSILKNGVNWDFKAGSIVNKNGGNAGILDDKGSPITCIIGGLGQFNLTYSGGAAGIGTAHVANTSSNIVALLDSISLTTTNNQNNVSTVYCENCQSFVLKATLINNIGSSAVVWLNGQMLIESSTIKSDNIALWCGCNATPTGDGQVLAGSIIGPAGAIYGDGFSTNTVGAFWVTCYGPIHGDVTNTSSNRLYVTAQKIFGYVGNATNPGQLYITTDKVAAITQNQALIQSFAPSPATLDLQIKHLDTNGYSGVLLLSSTGTGNCRVLGPRATTIDPNSGIVISNGNVTIRDCDFDFSGFAGIAEVFTITINNQPLNGSYLRLFSGTGEFNPWFSIDGGGSAPTVLGQLIQVSISSSDNQSTIESALASAVSAQIGSGWGSIIATSNVVTFIDATVGVRTTPVDGDIATGFILLVTTPGVNPVTGAIVSAGTLNLENSKIITLPAVNDLVQTGGTLNVCGGHGSGSNGNFTTTGTINFLDSH